MTDKVYGTMLLWRLERRLLPVGDPLGGEIQTQHIDLQREWRGTRIVTSQLEVILFIQLLPPFQSAYSTHHLATKEERPPAIFTALWNLRVYGPDFLA